MLVQKKIDYKTISIAGLLFILSLLLYHFSAKSKYFIRILLESQLLNYVFWCLSLIIFVVHYFKFKNKAIKSQKFITKKFGDFIDAFLGGIGSGTAITSSLTLIKGFYVQIFFGDMIYFYELDKIDLWMIFATVCFILYYVFMKVIDVAKEIIWTSHVEQVVVEGQEKVS